uniref:Uncharacterized protein n=1 Tax=Rhizophora mucronata TaxID=61149 RepID=A0A2P2N1F1_RHIMU
MNIITIHTPFSLAQVLKASYICSVLTSLVVLHSSFLTIILWVLSS